MLNNKAWFMAERPITTGTIDNWGPAVEVGKGQKKPAGKRDAFISWKSTPQKIRTVDPRNRQIRRP